MRNLQVMFHGYGAPTQYLFGDNQAALIAYDKIKAAMAQYKPYGNDKDSTVSVIGNDGLEATFRLDHLSGVSLGDPIADEALMTEHAKIIGRINGAHKAEINKVAPAGDPA